MAEKSKIEWTEATWNPVTGCDKISPGCKHCYAATIAERFWHKQYSPTVGGQPRPFTDVRVHDDRLDQPYKWRKPRRIFVNSMSDLFHADVPFSFIRHVWQVIADCQQHTFQILTKRPERMVEFTRWMAGGDDLGVAEWPRNAWLGVSVENQKYADNRIPLLLQTPAAVRWISAEPLVGPLSLKWQWVSRGRPISGGPMCNLLRPWEEPQPLPALDWVVVGGESGPGARPMEEAWARHLVEQCDAAGVAVFMKQGSAANWPRYKDFDSFPEDLRIREYPKEASDGR